MLAVWKREFQSYFLTPIGYVFIGMYLLINGIFFFIYNLMSGSSDLNTLFSNSIYVFMLIMPILTMRLLSEERKSRTDQLLLTSPCSLSGMVLGKFFAAASVLLIAMFLTGLYVVIVAIYASPYPLTIVSSYIGSFLIGCCYISVGVLMSSLTENQVSAAVLTFGVNLFLQILESISSAVTIPDLGGIKLSLLNSVLSWLSMNSRYLQFTSGIISFANILYFISICGIILFLSIRVIDRRRWSEG